MSHRRRGSQNPNPANQTQSTASAHWLRRSARRSFLVNVCSCAPILGSSTLVPSLSDRCPKADNISISFRPILLRISRVTLPVRRATLDTLIRKLPAQVVVGCRSPYGRSHPARKSAVTSAIPYQGHAASGIIVGHNGGNSDGIIRTQRYTMYPPTQTPVHTHTTLSVPGGNIGWGLFGLLFGLGFHVPVSG